MSDIRLISFSLCPYVQRSVITLLEKNVSFQLEYIDLRKKPDWFLRISPLGKVPVLQTQGVSIFESAVINEYLDEITAGHLMPVNPLVRAQHRMWIEFSSALLGNLWQVQSTHDKETYNSAVATIKNQCNRLNDVVTGTLFSGENFSLVDAAVAPALQRLAWMKELDKQLNVFEDNPGIKEWWQALRDRDSVQKSTVPNIKDLFLEMIAGLGGQLYTAAST